MAKTMKEEWMKIAAAARICCKNAGALYRAMVEGRLPYERHDGIKMVTRGGLEQAGFLPKATTVNGTAAVPATSPASAPVASVPEHICNRLSDDVTAAARCELAILELTTVCDSILRAQQEMLALLEGMREERVSQPAAVAMKADAPATLAFLQETLSEKQQVILCAIAQFPLGAFPSALAQYLGKLSIDFYVLKILLYHRMVEKPFHGFYRIAPGYKEVVEELVRLRAQRGEKGGVA